MKQINKSNLEHAHVLVPADLNFDKVLRRSQDVDGHALGVVVAGVHHGHTMTVIRNSLLKVHMRFSASPTFNGLVNLRLLGSIWSPGIIGFPIVCSTG